MRVDELELVSVVGGGGGEVVCVDLEGGGIVWCLSVVLLIWWGVIVWCLSVVLLIWWGLLCGVFWLFC